MLAEGNDSPTLMEHTDNYMYMQESEEGRCICEGQQWMKCRCVQAWYGQVHRRRQHRETASRHQLFYSWQMTGSRVHKDKWHVYADFVLF